MSVKKILPGDTIQVKTGRSKVWDYIGFYERDGEILEDDIYYCAECFKSGELVTYKKSNSTTVLAYHLEHVHGLKDLKEKKEDREFLQEERKLMKKYRG
jgi:hypothetical protein